MKAPIFLAAILYACVAKAELVSDHIPINAWYGSGENQAYWVVDWTPDNAGESAVTWGYRWNGTITAWDMIRDIAEANSDIYLRYRDFGGELGIAILGIGLDNGDDQFAIVDINGSAIDDIFIENRIESTTEPYLFAQAVNDGDWYAEGWYDPGSWGFFEITADSTTAQWTDTFGISNIEIADGNWLGAAWNSSGAWPGPAPSITPTAVPEPSGVVLLSGLAAGAGWWKRRRRLVTAAD